MRVKNLDQAIVDVLSDGRARNITQIHDAVYGDRYTKVDRTRLGRHLKALITAERIDATKCGRYIIYTRKGGDYSNLGFNPDPDILVGMDVDVTKNRTDSILDMLADGEIRTSEQLSRAYFQHARGECYDHNCKVQIVWNACDKLVKRGAIERIQLCTGEVGWRAIQ